MRMFLINNEPTGKKPPFIIGEKFQQALKREGFIEEIDPESCSIEVSGSSIGNDTLQKIIITGLDELSSVKTIWKINLEQEYRRYFYKRQNHRSGFACASRNF